MNSETYRHFFRKPLAKLLLLATFVINVNLLAGYIAVWLRFPTLWGGGKIFIDYALPINMTWAFAHWPSLILVSIALTRLPHWDAKNIKRFRVICLGLFLVLLYGVSEKIPFALFPAVDLITALFLSFIIVPPTYKENPKLTICVLFLLSIMVLSGIYCLYTQWQHQTPNIKETELMNGLFKLQSINVDNNYKKELLFTVELTQYLPEDEACKLAIEMGKTLYKSYPFDKKYGRTTKIIFNPKETENNSPYNLGGLEQYKEAGQINIGCYLKYK